MLYGLIVFLPLAAAIIAGFFGRVIGDRGAQVVTCGAVIVSALLSILAFWNVAIKGQIATVEIFTWIDSGDFEVSWAIRIDQLTAVMLLVVNGVSALVHVYSVGYMSHDPHIPRFMSYLSLFTFAMLMLVTSDNFVQMYMGWEGVGVASYLLIGFWYHRPSANAAAIKAFLVNRVGDFGFGLGIAGVYLVFGSVEFAQVFKAVPEMAGKTFTFLSWEVDILTVICLLLFMGAMGKSAQVPLHTWLPDAMEGPTPVSALIHAATMVTAGVFMVARCSPMLEYAPNALLVVAVIGGLTAFFAATVGLVQNDIKRVIAYSTCSQLGYMFFAAGVSAYAASIFHLFTHAFFKALLFLGAGSVIHGVAGEQDMRKMGGLWPYMKITYALMWIGSLALAGVPFFAGFYSKDAIIESAFATNTGVGHFVFWLGLAAAVMTAFYSWRLLFMTFHGAPRAPQEVMHHVHESPPVMTVPLMILAVGAVFAGALGAAAFIGEDTKFWGDSILVLAGHDALKNAHHVPLWVKLSPIVAGIVGIGLAWYMYIRKPDIPGRVAGMHKDAYQFLLNKWYFDELYEAIFVGPAKRLGHLLWKKGDGAVIDGLGPDGVAATTLKVAKRATLLETGYVYHYAFAMLIGIALLVSWYLFHGGFGS